MDQDYNGTQQQQQHIARKSLLYLIGVPGAGKTTLLSKALEGVEWQQQYKPIPHIEYEVSGVSAIQLGRYREAFGGTDSLGMSVQPIVMEWLKGLAPMRENEPIIVLGEGDRLANASFFHSVMQNGWVLNLVYYHLEPYEAQRRRAERAQRLHVPMQNEQWVKGRETKVRRLVEEFTPLTLRDNVIPDPLTTLKSHPLIQAIHKAAKIHTLEGMLS